MAAVQQLMNEFLEKIEVGDKTKQIVSLGAGYDTSYFKLTNAGKSNFKCMNSV